MTYTNYIHFTIPTKVDHFHLRDDWKTMNKWCAENFGPEAQDVYTDVWEWTDGNWKQFYGGYFSFINEEDAIAFKLRWL